MGSVCFSLSCCYMRHLSSGVKLGLHVFLLPLGMCLLSALLKRLKEPGDPEGLEVSHRSGER